MEEELNPLVPKRQYLITYSQADKNVFPTRESFGTVIEEEFNFGIGKVKVDYLAVCEEPHEHQGTHYHCSVKLTGPKKWKSVRDRISQKYNAQINFQCLSLCL